MLQTLHPLETRRAAREIMCLLPASAAPLVLAPAWHHTVVAPDNGIPVLTDQMLVWLKERVEPPARLSAGTAGA